MDTTKTLECMEADIRKYVNEYIALCHPLTVQSEVQCAFEALVKVIAKLHLEALTRKT